MSKTTRNVLIGSLICLLVGIIFCVIAIAIGATLPKTEQLEMVKKVTGIQTYDIKLDFDWSDFGENVVRGDVEKMNVTNGASVENIKFELAKGNVTIKESPDDDIYVSTSNGAKLGYALNSDKLVLASAGDNRGKANITLYLPDEEFQSIKLELGAGNFEVDAKLSCNELKVQSGAGKVTFADVSADELKLELGAGDAVFKKAEVDSAKFEVAAGNAEFNGDVNEKASVEVAAGNVTLALSGSEEDYSCKMQGGMGNFIIGDSNFSGIGVDQKRGNGDIALDLECAMGNVTVKFQ